MTFPQFTAKNLFRRPVRTALTVMGIGLGIGAVVALVGLAWGLKQSWTDALLARKTDLVVRHGTGGLVAEPFDQSVTEKLRAIPEVAATGGLLAEVLSVEDVPLMVVSGREWKSFLWDSLEVVEGALPKRPDEPVVVLGTIAAQTLKKKPGDKLTLEIEEFTVAAIVDGKAVVENGSIIMALPALQKLRDKPNMVSFINIQLKPGVKDLKATAQRIESQIPGLGLKVDLAEDLFAQNDGMKTFEAMSWGTSAIAILVGVFGVMNTMFMSVFERTREIGILIALGWKRSRILQMILLESVTLCALAGVLGVISGIILLKILAMTPWMHGRLEPHISPELLGLALGLAIVVGLASGLFPALRCTKINPSMAIREG